MKKIVVILLVLCFSISFGTFIAAAENTTGRLSIISDYQNENADNYVITILDDLSYIIVKQLNHLNYDLDDVYIGNAFNVFGEDVLYYPVYTNGEIVLLVEVAESSKGYSTTVGPFFADSLNQLDNAYCYKVVADQFGGFYAISNEDIFTLTAPIFTDLLVESKEILSITESASFMREYETVDVPERFATIQKESLTRGIGWAHMLYNYPRVMQTGSMDCWAACMASIVQKYGYADDVKTILNKTGRTNSQGSHIYEVKDWLKNLYSINSTLPYSAEPLTFSGTMAEIDAGRAYIQTLEYWNGGDLHNVLIMGYDATTSTNWVSYMDPAYGSYYDVKVSSDGVWDTPYWYNWNKGVLYKIYK